MEQAKHTPGPFKVIPAHSFGEPGKYLIRSVHGITIAIVQEAGGYSIQARNDAEWIVECLNNAVKNALAKAKREE